MKICKYPKCNREHKARGYCIKHYTRLMKHGDPSISYRKGVTSKIKICKIKGCNKEHEARGYCNVHYSHWRVKNSSKCIYPECNDNEISRGYCNKHYIRLRKHGDPSINKGKLPDGEASKRRIIHQYKKQAESRGHNWNLTNKQCENLFKGKCYYCGNELSCERDNGYNTGSYKYNGIDRMDNNKGYAIDNVVSCCNICNSMKSNLSPLEFDVKITEIFKKMWKLSDRDMVKIIEEASNYDATSNVDADRNTNNDN